MMCFDPNGAGDARPVEERPSLYALVIYLPPPLGDFLDDLRLEMVPECNPHAHVSVLPPRPLPLAPEAAIEESRRIVARFPPFDIELGKIEVFPHTEVIYISVEAGNEQLRRMHGALNQGALAFEEPFKYHPHVTLAQELKPGQAEPLLKLAERRWREFPAERKFRAERAVFVRNTHGRLWIDLADGPLQAVPVG
jgi:2'-5' RNA ligase